MAIEFLFVYPDGAKYFRINNKLVEEFSMLREEIESAKRSVVTDRAQLTVGEICNMYSDGELNISPEFQRLFRWTTQMKSSFIESILIGIPVPPVFAYEEASGKWELIDGLQRISTILEFTGRLKDVDTGAPRRSQLNATKYLRSLDRVVWEKRSDDEAELDKALQLFFRRARIDFQILKHPSDPKTKFDLFQRLNRGGAYANEQEVRTCSMVLANADFTQRIRLFAQREDFRALCRINEDSAKTQKDMDYAVRLIVHTFADFTPRLDVEEFLDASILRIITELQPEDVVPVLAWTVDVLRHARGNDALIPTENSQEIANRFSLRALEAIAVGIARNQKHIVSLQDPIAFIKERITSFWHQPDVKEMSASGLRGTSRLQKTVPFGEQWFRPHGNI